MGQLPGPYEAGTRQGQQEFDWSCSCRTAYWMLRALGGTDTPAEIAQKMLNAGLVTPAQGLLLGDGSGLAQFLAEESGWPTQHRFPMAWDDLLDVPVGSVPVGLGGALWYHWVGARDWLDAGVWLANSAEGYKGIGSLLTEADYQRLGQFAVVWIEYEGEALSAEEQAELAQLRTVVASYVDDTFTPIAATLDRLLAERPDRSTLLDELQRIRASIQQNVGV